MKTLPKVSPPATLPAAPVPAPAARPNTRYQKLKSLASRKRQLAHTVGNLKALAQTGPSAVPITVPGPDPSNQEAVKYYVFNQTGNIMMSSTDLSSETITQAVRDVYNEVSVFFAAMTKAISTTINPVTKKPYSIYDYNAIMSIVSGSGLFIHVTEEDLIYNTSTYGTEFSTQLIEGLLGLATGSGEMSFAQAMIASLGSAALDISSASSSSDSKVANIIFVCEYLLGMPMVSAIVVYCDMATNIQQVQVGPCYSETSVQTNWTMHKDVYMFVTPKFIEQYAGDLLAVESNTVYSEFVSYLSNLLIGKPSITAVNDAEGSPAPGALKLATEYQIVGECFGTTAGTLFLGKQALAVSEWSDTNITFTTPSQAEATAAPILLFLSTNKTSTPDASSADSYTVGS